MSRSEETCINKLVQYLVRYFNVFSVIQSLKYANIQVQFTGINISDLSSILKLFGCVLVLSDPASFSKQGEEFSSRQIKIHFERISESSYNLSLSKLLLIYNFSEIK